MILSKIHTRVSLVFMSVKRTTPIFSLTVLTAQVHVSARIYTVSCLHASILYQLIWLNAVLDPNPYSLFFLHRDLQRSWRSTKRTLLLIIIIIIIIISIIIIIIIIIINWNARKYMRIN